VHAWALVEISSRLSSGYCRRLVTAAYRASKHGQVCLLLHGPSRSEMDQLLDGVVRDEGTDVFGVQYFEGNASELLLGENVLVIATSSGWKAYLVERGIPFLAAREGLDRLESMRSAGGRMRRHGAGTAWRSRGV